MEAGRARCNRDDNQRLPTLSLGLSSVRLIVNKFEAGYTRAASDAFESNRELVAYDPRIDKVDDDSSLGTTRDRVWHRLLVNLGIALCKCIPSVTLANFTILSVFVGFFAPKMISYLVIYPFCRLVFGTLYPAYASYKAVRTKNLKEYVKWMMYWIVFALFTCTETFTDVFLSWFPFYYEVKIVLVLWLLSPATKGSSILYRKFVHPALCRREQEIDEYIAKAKDQGYHTVLNLGTKGVNYATTVIMQTAIKGGGGLVQQIRKSYSLSDLTECDVREERAADEADDVLSEPRAIRRVVKSGYNTRRSASESNSRTPMYFPEVDVDVRGPRTARTDEPDFSHIKSTEDISSGYSSADNSASLARTGSVGAGGRVRARTTRTTVTTIKRPQAAEDNEVIIEELPDDDTFEYTNMPPLINLPPHLFLSDTDPPFIYQYIGDQVKIVQLLANSPLGMNFNQNNIDYRDQKDAIDPQSTEKPSPDEESIHDEFENAQDDLDKEVNQIVMANNHKDNNETNEFPNTKSVIGTSTKVVDNDKALEVPEPEIKIENEQDLNKDATLITSNKKEDNNTGKEHDKNIDKTSLTTDEREDTTSLDTSAYDNDSAESDDEASFGTPDNSPRSKRKSKSPKGKYGKGKAPPPPPPKVDKINITSDTTLTVDVAQEKAASTTSQESLSDILHALPNNSFKETGSYQGLQVVNPIAEKKRRHKSKSPGRIPKGNAMGIGKLLQIPSKLAFWHKSDDKSKSDTTSNPSRSRSHSKSSAYEPTEINDDQLSFVDAADFESEVISHDIMEKSDALQKLIEAKLESHPEYKFVSLHDEIPTTSKSTDV
ncbi:uncharacterized protein isoform X1 [Choristoneura fumiferana]|uniref:uncharacterized protein isoform X1 n=1 Tax=Choristoneura fumiferana TaxID=7141 RepID=UPI003D15E5F5